MIGIDKGLAEGRSLQIGIVRVDLGTNSSNFSLERTGITTNTGEDGRNKQTRETFESFLEKLVGTSKVKTDIVVGSEGIGAALSTIRQPVFKSLRADRDAPVPASRQGPPTDRLRRRIRRLPPDGLANPVPRGHASRWPRRSACIGASTNGEWQDHPQ
eukprot:2785057-Rhodomonas_salina.1